MITIDFIGGLMFGLEVIPEDAIYLENGEPSWGIQIDLGILRIVFIK